MLKEVKYQITVMESERGWGQNYWTENLSTREKAEARIKKINSSNTDPTAPDYYIKAFDEIKIVEVNES